MNETSPSGSSHGRFSTMRVGILDILTTPARSWAEAAYKLALTKQYASVFPQAIAVWCREMGHRTFYATYYGAGDPKRSLPADLDVVFIAVYTQASALAYALAKLYRREGVLTVIGGPHAKAFPTDCLRYFDVVVREGDKPLIADILKGVYDPGTIVSSSKPLEDLPTVEERMPEIRASAFLFGRRPYAATVVPMLASVGCPYQCDFCIDWNTPYRLLPTGRLEADLRYLSRSWPGLTIAYHDPNFAVRFDEVLDVMERIPPERRNPYLIESSLTILRGERIPRLGATNCAFVGPGVESWGEYSNKAGVGRATGPAKVERVAEHFRRLYEHVPYLQANFMFGLDTDAGDEPIELTKEFMTRTPFVWPVVNIPHPFGGTPLYERYLEEGRILTSMPFAFYYSPYLVTRLKNYHPDGFYRRLIDLFTHFTSAPMLARRVASARHGHVRTLHVVRTFVKRRRVLAFRRILHQLETDRSFRAFHEGETPRLPEFYHRELERLLGHYAELIPREERTPLLATESAPARRVASSSRPLHGPRPEPAGRRTGGGGGFTAGDKKSAVIGG
jgi:radical SAM superfamily enzyme YgiQ (UPF0313 family)